MTAGTSPRSPVEAGKFGAFSASAENSSPQERAEKPRVISFRNPCSTGRVDCKNLLISLLQGRISPQPPQARCGPRAANRPSPSAASPIRSSASPPQRERGRLSARARAPHLDPGERLSGSLRSRPALRAPWRSQACAGPPPARTAPRPAVHDRLGRLPDMPARGAIDLATPSICTVMVYCKRISFRPPVRRQIAW